MPGFEAAKAFIDDEMGEMLALKAWYCDSTHRYAMTDAVQPLIVTSAHATQAVGQSEGRSPPLLHARARQPSGRHRALSRRRDRRGRGAAERAVRRLLLVRRRRVRQRRARPSRPDRRGAHGLARGLPDLRRERQRSRQDLQPLVLQDERGRHFPRERPARRRACSAPTAISTAASSRASPTRS